MKRTVILFLCMLVAFSAFSRVLDSRHIKLQAIRSNTHILRSVNPVSATLDENVISLDFKNSPENVTVRVTDVEGKEIIVEDYTSPQLVKLQAIKTSGNYTIEIVYGETILYGDFVIE